MTAATQPIRLSTAGSPRSRRSVQQGTSSTFNAPAVPGEQYVPAPPTALHTTDGDAFNVDPAVPYISAGETAAQKVTSPGSSRSSRRFSKLSQLARRAMGKTVDEPLHHPEEGVPLAPTRSRSPPAVSPSSSNTVHDEADEFEGTTVVSHEMLPVAEVMGSPVYIEPQPTNDYAKMESPRMTIASFTSYLSRVREFFRDINELPWVAERVTVDFVPGEFKGRRQFRERPQRPISWYGDTPHSRPPIPLFSDTTSPSSQLPAPTIETQMQDPGSTPFPAPLSRSLPPEQPEQPPMSQQLRPPTPPPEVIWEILKEGVTSNAPFAHVVPSTWSLHQPPHVPLPHRTVPIPPPSVPEPPHQARYAPNPLPDASSTQHTQQLFPDAGTTRTGPDGYQQFRPSGEVFPTGFVRHEDVESTTAGFSGRTFHPRPSPDPNSAQSLHGSERTVRGAGTPQTSQGGPGTAFPQTPRGLETNSVNSTIGAHAPNAQAPQSTGPPPPVTFATPRSTAPTFEMSSSYVMPTPGNTSIRLVSASKPPSVAPSRASRASRAPSTSSRANQQPPAGTPAQGLGQGWPSSPAPPSQNLNQNRSRPPSVAPSYTSRAPSATASRTCASPSAAAQATPRADTGTPASMRYPNVVSSPVA